MPRPLPRVFLLRHGQTEWSVNGRHTGSSDIPLTADGERIVTAFGAQIVGPGKLLDPAHLHTIFVSPRVRARKTFELVFSSLDTLPECEIEEGVREWEYGAYEGLKTHEIRALPGHAKWDIWTDGCEGGESSAQMSDRVDAMIAKIVALGTDHHGAREDYDGKGRGDVLVVSHGHFSRCFLTRWAALPLSQGRIFVVDAGAISIAGYQHENFAERSILGLNLQNF